MQPGTQAARIDADGLACRRGDRLLFAGLSLALRPGKAVQLIGANGIGKSSLIRILAGLMRPFAGHVTRIGAVGLVDERPALDPQLPLGRALRFWRGIDGAARDAQRPAITALELDGLMDVPVRFLSTGQRKRAALARLLGQQAPIWLLDEPLNGLDTAAVALVEALVENHCRDGGLAVIASHQPFALAGLTRIELADYAA
jgi:heme exporter protein A